MDFEEALDNYVKLAQAKTAERDYSGGKETELAVAPRRSKRCVKIVEVKDGKPRSVFAFIEIASGDVLKAASWNAPAKHARGNIFADDPLKGTTPYGPEYLYNWRR